MSIEILPQLLKRRRTKIVATLGPASSSPEVVARLIEAGVGVFRLNMSHGDRDGHLAVLRTVRDVAAEAGEPVALLGDLCGPKIRVGAFREGAIVLREGDSVRVVLRDVPGEAGVIPVAHPSLAADVRAGHRLLLADGTMELEVRAVEGEELACTVVVGGELTDRKGVNAPDSSLSLSSLTDKDRADARFLLEAGVDFLALSFVRTAEDIQDLRACIGSDARVRIIAKIEKPEALQNIDAILDASDAIMVARGDLGVEVPSEAVPAVQEELVTRARRHHKPSIIATQMLESMLHNPRPTRAEVADIAHAVGSGADALMLSGETAVGGHPVKAVAMMDRVIRQTEAGQWRASAFRSLSWEDADAARMLPTDEAVARAVSHMSRDLSVRAILVLSRSGTSGMVVSSARPSAPLLAATASEEVCRLMNLYWGVVPIQVEERELDQPGELFRRIVAPLGLAEPGQPGLIVRGFQQQEAQSEPSITVVRL